ncbi:hypothetical protein Pla110_11170 [Polystyrenella longa]|uniref:DUF2254 domain-containing protein n=1 Tax=Polystyrenella longa TaxID=2528007 RepID=A0A518CJM9_9PLAN|nr:DUF2254 domain-containing protein [Polystyrenella longa]QDU79407.1 hypothetical protein Pla110_11170 [Polystyrenella longa]
MKTYLLNLWDSFRGSFWFRPTLMILFAIVLSEVTHSVDVNLAQKDEEVEWFSTTSEAARSTLTAVASATIALAGVVFSITILSLSIASTQFGSRLVRNVMSDSIADWVIGQYIGSALFCLLVLRTIREPEYVEVAFVPHIGTAVGVGFGLISMWLLIWFIHHVATSIQAPNLVESVADELGTTIERLFPEHIGRPRGEEDESHTAEEALSRPEGETIEILCSTEGYIEGIDGDTLISEACEHKGLLKLNCKPGNFVTYKETLAEFQSYQSGDDLDEDARDSLIKTIQQVIIIGPTRTPRQDISYAVLQLVEIAVRALSPGINDPFTAMGCIDRFSGALCTLAERDFPEIIRRDEEGTPRVVLTNVDRFPEILNDAFNMVRQNGIRSVAVSIRMIDSLLRITAHVTRKRDREAIKVQAIALKSGFDSQGFVESDRQEFDERYQKLMTLLVEKSDH